MIEAAKKRLLIIDDHPVVHDGLVQLLGNEPRLTVCGRVSDAAKALESARTLNPDLIILDLTLQGANGLDLIKDLRSFLPAVPILVFSMHDEAVYAARVLRAGARGYVMKMHPAERMREAIHRLLAGGIYLSEAMTARSIAVWAQETPGNQNDEGVTKALSNRELQVLQQVGLGRRTRTIADELHISTKTVETHRAHLREKLGLVDSQALVQFAIHWVQHGDRQS